MSFIFVGKGYLLPTDIADFILLFTARVCTILRTFEPCLSSLVTEEVNVPASYIRPKTMFDRDGLFVKFSSTRVYPYIETLLSSQAYDVVICCWDLASNAMGRAYVLAEMLARDNNSVLVIARKKLKVHL